MKGRSAHQTFAKSIGRETYVKKVLERARRGFDGCFAVAEDSRGVRPFQSDGAVLNAEERALANTNYVVFVFFKELADPLLLCFAHVGGGRVGIEVMRADLERDQAQGIERGWLNY